MLLRSITHLPKVRTSLGQYYGREIYYRWALEHKSYQDGFEQEKQILRTTLSFPIDVYQKRPTVLQAV
jgi:hypothetical protein